MDCHLKKLGQLLSSFEAVSSKITQKIIMVNGKFIWYLSHSFTGAFYVWVKALSNDFSTEVNPLKILG